MTPGSTPSTPASAQFGTVPAGGGSGKRHRGLSVETKNGAVDVRLFRKDADVAREVARRKIIRAVDYDLVALDQVARIRGGETRLVQMHLDLWIDLAQTIARRFHFRSADFAGAIKELPLKIREFDPVCVHQPDRAHARRGQIHGRGRTQTAQADAQNARGLQSFLTCASHLGHGKMPRITPPLIIR